MSKRSLTLALLTLSTAAHATASFPHAVQTHLGLAAHPPQSCSFCHTNGIVGNGTVNTPFGKAIRARGAVGYDEGRLFTALDQLASDNVDSDGDGVTDINELKAGTDPNVATGDGGTGGGTGGGGGVSLEAPRYGCGATVVPELLACASVLLLGLRRARRR